jgi:hypothetical protein
MTAAGQPVSLSAWREQANARERCSEYLGHAYACHDMAAQALDAHDAQFLRAMTIVWQVLADRCAAAPEVGRGCSLSPGRGRAGTGA